MESLTGISSSILNSIDRSSVRKRILLHLYRSPQSTLYDVARATQIAYTNVTGGVAGYGNRYGKDRSLIHLGLVCVETGSRGLQVYSLTPEGQKLARALNRQLP